MSRNRNVQLHNLTFLGPADPDCFGEKVAGESAASVDSLDAFLDHYQSSGKSSSSCLSWGESQSGFATAVQKELDRMDRVLQGQEAPPAHYDTEEYAEWMEFFPNLCVVGRKAQARQPSTLDSCLQVSRLPRRLNSSKSLIASQKSASKWLRDEDNNYSSLPFIAGVKCERTARKGILKNALVLPPIQGRSISATPRASKSLSALSNKFSSKNRV